MHRCTLFIIVFTIAMFRKGHNMYVQFSVDMFRVQTFGEDFRAW